MSIKPGLDVNNFDKAVRPQDDLFQHTNGKWIRETEIPSDQAIYGSFHMLRDASEEAVRDILLEASADAKPGVSQQIGDLYNSFLNEDLAEELGFAPISGDFNRIDDVANIDEFMKMLGEYARQGIGGFFGLYVDNDPGNPERYLPHLMQSGLGLPDEAYYREEKYQEIRDAYVAYIAQMFQHAGLDSATADSAGRKVFEFETALASHHWDVVESRDAEKTYNLYSLAALQESTPGLDWNQWTYGCQIKPAALSEVVVMMPSFFAALPSLFNDENLADAKLWFQWQVVNSMAPYLSKNFVNTRFAFYGTKLTGQPEMRARWKRAVGLVEGALGEAVGEIYVEKHFPPAAKAQMDELVGWLIEAYRLSIKDLDWMTAATKAKALIKLDKFTPKIGYPTKWKDYSSLAIRADDLVGNVRRASSWETDREMAKIGSAIDREEWFMTPQTVNAYYNPGFNEIVFPAAILQPPFFSSEADAAVNFGAIGAVIGHEIGHGFDDQGSKYDGDGALVSWWTDEDREAFEKLTRELIFQYDQLSPAQLSDEHRVNGALTIGENIGDLGGLSIAYKAYLLSLNGEEPPVIDGLTGAQRLFLSWGQAWRTVGRDEITIQRLATDPHSPAEFRCNQIVRNINAFYEAFGVSESDGLWLDPASRVSIW